MQRSSLRQPATGAALRRLCCLVKSLYNVVIIVEWCSCSFGVTTRYSVRKGCKHAALTSELNQWGSLRGFVSHPSWPTCSCVGGWRNSLHPQNLRACLKVWPGLALRREVFQPALSSALEGTWPLVGGSLWPSHADSASQLFIFFCQARLITLAESIALNRKTKYVQILRVASEFSRERVFVFFPTPKKLP